MQLVTDSKFYLFSTILSSGITFLLLPFYTQYLSPSDFGVVALFGTFGQVSTGLISFGIHKATYKYFFDYEKNRAELLSMVSTNLLYTFVLFLIVGIFVYYNSNWFSVKLFDSQIDNNIIRLSYFCGCLNYFIAFITLLLTAQSRSKEYAIVTITRAIINNILCFYFIIGYSLTFMAKIYAAIITQSILVLILLFLIRDMIGFKFSLSKLKKSLIFSYPNAPRSIIGLIYRSFDKIFIKEQ